MAKNTNKNTSVITKKNANVNANVKNNKEENKMTKQNMNELRAMLTAQLEAEHEGVSFNPSAEAPEKVAKYDNLGMQIVEINSIKYIDVKYTGDPDTGKETRFMKAIEVTIPGNSFLINDPMFLYEGDRRVDINIYDSITDGSGTIGYYFTVKDSALEKKANELDVEKDIEIHVIKEGQRIWRPARKEFTAINKAYNVAELEFKDNQAVIPENAKVAIYVYEDVIKDKELRKVNGEIKKFQKFQYFYNVSFIKPEDIYDMKYGRAFTTSEDSTRRAEIQNLPGVQAYLENC